MTPESSSSAEAEKVVKKERLIDECFDIVERIARISPETIQVNLQVATQGLEMMGLLQAWLMNNELSAVAHASQREEFVKPLNDAYKKGGLRSLLETRDGPFQPEPMGPRSHKDARDQD